MTVKSKDGRLTVQRYTDSTVIAVGANGLLSENDVFTALEPLLPPPVPTAREVAEEALTWADSALPKPLFDLARRWDQAGRP